MGSANRRLDVALVQGVLPHYRRALFAALDRSPLIKITYVTSGRDLEGIPHLPENAVERLRIAKTSSLGALKWQSGVVALALSRRFDALVLIGDPHYLSSWIAAGVARLRRKPVLFWTHGWLRAETGFKRFVRLCFFKLADRLLLYGERGKRLGIAAGYPPDRMAVVYNSLDLDRADAVIHEIERSRNSEPPASEFFSRAERPLLVCTARLTDRCRFDLLLQAASMLRNGGEAVNVLLIGEGPARAALEALAGQLDVDAHFTGAVYDEQRLGNWLYHADLTVSPGKVGLTAIHSLMYGTPVLTHRNLDQQMPEVEAVVDGETGAFFSQDDAADLAHAIGKTLTRFADRQATRARCRALVRNKWSPQHQCSAFEDAIVSACGEPVT